MSVRVMVRGWLHLTTAAALLSCPVAPLGAQTISADRPGFDFSPLVLERGVLQIETGFLGINRSPDGGPRFWTLDSQLLVRTGIGANVELRFGGSPFRTQWTTSSGVTTSETGVSDVELGVKWAARSEPGFLIAVIPSLLLPTGSDAFTADHAVITTNVTGATALSETVGLSINIGGSLVTGAESVTSGSLAVVLARAFDSRFGGFVETGAFATEGSGTTFLAGGGLTFLVSPLTQIDVSVDRGLNANADDWLLGLGLAVRF